MKKVLLIVAVCFMVDTAQAGYFRRMDIKHPQTSAGAFFDLQGHSDAGVSLALITHNTVDGCIIPGVCLDWTPLAIGGTLGRSLGGPSIAIGTSANMLPVLEKGLLQVVNAVFPLPSSCVVLKKMLSPSVAGAPDISIAIGPHWSYVLTNGLQGKGMVTLFSGAAWKF